VIVLTLLADLLSLQNLLTFTMGLAFYVPGEFEREEL